MLSSTLQACFQINLYPARMNYGERLQLALELAERDRAELAAALGISVQAIGQTLRGETKAHTAENCAKAAKFLRVDWYWLATGEGEPRPKSLPLKAERDSLSAEAVMHAMEFDGLAVAQRQTWRAVLAAVLAGQDTQKATHGITLEGQSAGMAQDELAIKNNKKVLLVSSQPEPKPPRGANLGTFGGRAQAKPKESNASHKASRVRK